MATIQSMIERSDSRDGGIAGAFGVRKTRVFRVILNISPGERTPERMPNPAGMVAGVIVRGSQHPWNAFAIAQHYQELKHYPPDMWDIAVHYENISADTPIETGWLRSTRSATIQVRMLKDLDGKPIGDPLYTLKDEDVSQGALANHPFWTDTTFTVDGETRPQQMFVSLNASSVVQVDGEDVDMPAVVTSFTKLVSMDAAVMDTRVVPFYKKINSTHFLNVPPGHCKFDDYISDPEPTQEFVITQGVGNNRSVVIRDFTGTTDRFSTVIVPARRVTLAFLLTPSDFPLDTATRIPVFRHPETGAESSVMFGAWPGRAATETFRLKERVDFNQLFGVLES